MPHEAEFALGDLQGEVDATLDQMAESRVVERIWERDHTVWQPDPEEIANRLGWLDIADRMLGQVDGLEALVRDVRDAGYTHVLLLGMGGSSLAPDVFSKVLGRGEEGLALEVLDSTVPGAVLHYAGLFPPERTLYVVSTKSGGTVETLSFFKTFYNLVAERVGVAEAGAHFVAITDGGSKLDTLAQDLDFRAVFRNDPNLGGRYSALSFFGLVPAALLGADLHRLLQDAVEAADDAHTVDSPAVRLGAALGALANAGCDKLTLIASPPLVPFGDWVEQLIAESTGKAGKGILPVVGEPVAPPEAYGSDRVFVYLKLGADNTFDDAVSALEAAGQPVIRFHLEDRYQLGGQMFLWELATAVAGHVLGIHPFNQPNVESAKVRAREVVSAYEQEGALPEPAPVLTDEGISVYGDTTASSAVEALRAFVQQGRPGGYISLQAYVEPSEPTSVLFGEMQGLLHDQTGLATTLGYGPRFLHSTGQLHKGDAGNGLFVQFTADDPADVPIPQQAGSPDSAMTFSVLKLAQALGDAQALRDADRLVLRLDLGADVQAALRRLLVELS